MILTGAFLAEGARQVDNKLDVAGGVLARYAVGPDRVARFTLVVLTRADEEKTDPRVDVDFKPPTLDEPTSMRFEVPQASIGEFPGFAFFDIEVRLPSDGRWAVEVTAGGETLSLPLVVTGWTEPPSSLLN